MTFKNNISQLHRIILLFATISCTDDIHRTDIDSGKKTSGCYVYNQILDDYLCVNAIRAVCDFRFGEWKDKKCENMELADCEDGTWTASDCPHDDGGACIISDAETEEETSCVTADRAECLTLAETTEWRMWTCIDHGFYYYCNPTEEWVVEAADCVEEDEPDTDSACVVESTESEATFCFEGDENDCAEASGEWYPSYSCDDLSFSYSCDDGLFYEAENDCPI